MDVEIAIPRDDAGPDSEDIKEWVHLLFEREGSVGLEALSTSIAVAEMEEPRTEREELEELLIASPVAPLGPAGRSTAIASSSLSSYERGSVAVAVAG